MGHFAKIEDGLVTQVVVADDDKADWLTKLRFNYAGRSYYYDETRDAFIPPKPFESWVLDESTCLWTAPIPYPADGGDYVWDEATTDWVEVVDEAV